MRKRPANRIVMVAVAGLGLVLLGRVGLLRPANNALGVVGAPVMQVFSSAGTKTGNFFKFLSQIKDLNRRNIELTREVNDLRLQLAADAEMRVQAAALKQQLGFSAGAADSETVPAQILAYQPDNFRAFITINRGRSNGLADGMAVTSQGVLIGRLVNTLNRTAQVFLLSDPDFRVAVVDQQSRATGTVHGQIGGGLVLVNVPQDQPIKPGETLVTSGLGGDFPKGLIVGKIETVSRRDNAIFQSAQVVPFIKIEQLELVFVMKKQ
jgi:rod shape-determining protein MreC